MTILSGVLCFAIWLPAHSAQLVIAFTCLYGFCSGIFISVTPAAIGQITPEGKLGSRLGAFFSTTAIATLIGTPIGGVLIQGESRDGYRFLITFAVCHNTYTRCVAPGLTNNLQASTLIFGGGILLLGRIFCEKNLRKKW